jgi:hypothetical protein
MSEYIRCCGYVNSGSTSILCPCCGSTIEPWSGPSIFTVKMSKMCPCKLANCSLHYWDEYSNSFRIRVMK